MKRNGRLYIIAGIVLAVAAGALLFFYLTSVRNEVAQQQLLKAPPPTPIPDVSVVVLTQDIRPATIITGEMLRSETRKQTDVPPDAVRSASEVIDQMLAIETKSGTVLRRADVQPVAFNLPKGKKAMAVFVDDLSSIAGLVRERDYVDIVVVEKMKVAIPAVAGTPTAGGQAASKPQAKPGEEQTAVAVQPTDDQHAVKTVAQRVQVIKVVTPPQPQPANQQGNQAATQPPAAPTPTSTTAAVATPTGRISGQNVILVLAVTDQEAEIIRFVRDTGQFQLIMRGRDDSEIEETKGMTLDILIRDYGVPVPRPVTVKVKTD